MEAASFAASTSPRFGTLDPPRTQIAPALAPLRPGRDATYRRLLAIADVASALLALFIGISVLGEDSLTPLALVALPLVVVVAKVVGLYDRDELLLNKTTLDEAPALFQAATGYTLLIALSGDLLVHGNLGSGQLLGVWLVLFLATVAGRSLARGVARRGVAVERCLVLGDLDATLRLASKLDHRRQVHATVIGRVPLEQTHEEADEFVLGRFDDLPDLVIEQRVDRVIVAPHGSDSEQMLKAIRLAKALGVQVSVLPRMLEVVGRSVEFDHIYGLTLLGVRRFGLTQSSALIKRTMDVVGASLAMIVLTPVLIASAVAVKLSSPGPVLFRQRRVGHNGSAFEIVKFRTMVDGADALKHELHGNNEAADGFFKIAEDPRITTAGGYLRRTALDELPQLINVLRGEMSLVGPRPLVEEEDRRIAGAHRRRLALKPGMTGNWQIFGSSQIPLQEMVTIDYLYVANWSLWSDVKILCRTIPHMVTARGL